MKKHHEKRERTLHLVPCAKWSTALVPCAKLSTAFGTMCKVEYRIGTMYKVDNFHDLSFGNKAGSYAS